MLGILANFWMLEALMPMVRAPAANNLILRDQGRQEILTTVVQRLLNSRALICVFDVFIQENMIGCIWPQLWVLEILDFH